MVDSAILIEQSRQLVAAARQIAEESRRVRAEAESAVIRMRRTLDIVQRDRLETAMAKGPQTADARACAVDSRTARDLRVAGYAVAGADNPEPDAARRAPPR